MAVPVLTGIKAQRTSSHPDPTPIKKTPPATAAAGSDLYTMWGPTNEWGYQDAVGSSQPVDKGWDAVQGRLGPKRRAGAINQSNAVLTDGKAGLQMSIFVSNLGIDSSLSGSSAQSQLVRDFYPHNFVQPAIVVTGWSLDQEDYGLLCEFIHSCQHKSITSGSGRWPDSLTQICVFGRDGERDAKGNTIPGTGRGFDGNRTFGNKVTVNGKDHWNQTIRGSHKSTVAKGYVATMPRQHAQFQNAVQWQFSFTVSAMLEGLYRDGQGIPVEVQKTWKDVLAEAQAVGVSTITSKKNKASLAYAAKNAATLTPGK